MANLKNIKLRMMSVQNTMHITKAMKMVSAAKMKHAEQRVVNARPYTTSLQNMLFRVIGNGEHANIPLLKSNNKTNKAILVLFTSDRGLCGGLNSNLCRAVEKFIQNQKQQVELLIFGKKGNEFFKTRKEYTIHKTIVDIKEKEVQKTVRTQMEYCLDLYTKQEIDTVYVASNLFKNVITHEQSVTTLLPIKLEKQEEQQVNETFLFEQEEEVLLGEILPEYAINFVTTACLNQMACDQAARMTAMDSASNNAVDMLNRLSLQYNRERQSAITTELTEIVSGAESV